MMATEQNKPSVIAKLMGLDEVPSKQQPVYRHIRVFSENYLQKSASIVSRQKRSSKSRQKSRQILKKANATINDSSKDVSLRYVEQKRDSFDGKQYLKSTIVDHQNNAQNGKLGKGIEERNGSPANVPRSNIGNVKRGSKPSFLLDSDTTFAWEFKKQLLERSKRTKICQEIWSSRRVNNLVEGPSLPDFESKQRSKLGTQVVICKTDGWKDKSMTKLPLLKRFNFSSIPNSKLKKMSKGDFSSSSGRHNHNNLSTNSEDVEFSSSDAMIKQISEQIACNDSAKEGCFPCSLDVSFEQDSSFEDGFTTFNCIDIDDGLPKSTGEAYQPSPNSVLEPDNSSISDGDAVSTDLHGLWMKLQILKSESEENQSKPEMVTLSDEDATERSSLGVGQNTKPIRSFGPKGSREFSYLVDVLNDSGFLGSKMEVNYVRSECMMSTLLFETLEKNYGKQESWSKADRQLLFDRINSGLSEIFRPQLDLMICSKPLRRKMVTILSRDIVEEELWNLLLGQEKEVNGNLSEKAVGKEPWLELVDEVGSIVGEIEAFLFDKLATELVVI
ncbi:uncharacterized protein LOC112525481 [Cynara cardunculus var. scolymus]|uniref:DUF4378 domain-containing protein n=1 Tax=Cynara cardunculus var. scolymus TaxID=59895 RepID=A0A124SG16_CYNCS|nr:uncharacterized protein LOC112525481 [Cynara cardunculus var. scolymus]KVI04966.1 protein of unknown function DUF4378 [Cynara cardunculus var. scolymus]